MNGEQHITISIATAGVVLVPLIASFPPAWIVFALFGVFIGALAPDADANDSAIFHTRLPGGKRRRRCIVLPLFGYTIRYLIYYPISVPFIAIFGKKAMPKHRGILHSAIGVILMTFLLGVYAYIAGRIVLQIPWSPIAGMFLLGFFGGAVCHLLEDSCTRSGVAWLFPLSGWRVRGGIVTGSRDLRPGLFAGILAAAAAILLLAGHEGPIQAPLPPWSGALCAAGLWVIFLFAARIGR
ncbi:metal-dependent hydrolase [Methanofollis fontis]|uniref:Metal-dependent hydrolase n=1 Tax=Methanofollis fontis TaxID=2052832 RepID=A0A483CXV6_9EURY|nr:metal-dependent hydrolase [Methanofollis fontis]TAJ44213.1 hypothetical protein CUJ86_09325 [Methanofollis fontis]